MSVTQYLKEKGKPTRRFVGGFAAGTREITYNDLNPRERQDYDRWLNLKQTNTSQIKQGSFTSALFGRGGTNVSSVNIPPPDLSFSTFLKEKGYKNYVRTGLFRRKRAKTIGRASSKERREYESWKADKQFEYNRKVKEAAENNVRSSGGSQSFGFETANIQIQSTPSQRELNNKKRLEQIERIEAVDLSLDLGNYIGDKTLEERYPGLVQSIAEQVVSYGNTFRADEEYAEVVVTNTINNALEVANHINWLITPPNNTTDVELRSIDEMGSWSVQTTESVGLGTKSDGTLNLNLKEGEQPKEVPQKIFPRELFSPILEIKKDAKLIEKTKTLPFDVRSGILGSGFLNVSSRFRTTSPNQSLDNLDGFRIKRTQRVK